MPNSNVSVDQILELIDEANRARLARSGTDDDEALADAFNRYVSPAEQRLDNLFQVNQTLAAYGTLAPGRSNHHIVQPFGGDWCEGLIEGDLFQVGWGAALGYPGFRPRSGGECVTAHVLKSKLLSNGWELLDAFEGPGYWRILVPVYVMQWNNASASQHAVNSRRRELLTVANLYAAKMPEDK